MGTLEGRRCLRDLREADLVKEVVQPLRIAWCSNCGNLSPDGLNFGGGPKAEDKSVLQCGRCGCWGRFAYEAVKPKP